MTIPFSRLRRGRDGAVAHERRAVASPRGHIRVNGSQLLEGDRVT
ncbi:hypothetical protein [Intrasporangium mesophilum]